MSDVKDPVFANWSESAGFWDKHRAARWAMFEPVIPELCKDASISDTRIEGQYQILEIAGGPGDVSMGIAEGLGSKATVWCTDFVPEMVQIAQRTAAERGLRNVHTRECRAEELPFDSNSFDALVCRFGIMFFSDPVKSIRDALRVLKPGRRLAHCVWGTRQANPFHYVIQDVLDRYVPGPNSESDAPGAYRFAPLGKLAAVFSEAEAADVRERILRFNIAAPLSFNDFFEVRTEMSDSLRAKLRKLSFGERAAFKEDVRRNSEPYFFGGGFRFPAEVLLVSGRK